MLPQTSAGRTVAGIVLAVILFGAGNSLVGKVFGGASLDLTDQNLYSLSDGTRRIISRIDEPITLKLYYSTRLGQQIPTYGVYAQQVTELLREYASLSKGKIHLEVLDPQPFSEVEDQATAAGLQSAPLGNGGEVVYFGLTGSNSTDDSEVIPFFQRDREKFLEYDLTKLVQALAFPKKKVVGLMTNLALDGDPMAQMRGQPTQPQAVLEQLRQNYEVRNVQANTDSIPEDVDVLMIAQPQKLAPKTEYAIDQWVLKGGHALVFADPLSEFAQSHRSPMAPPGGGNAADFDHLLNAWGVDLAKGKFVADHQSAQPVNAGDEDHPMQADYIAWLALKGDSINSTDPITGRLTAINVGTVGALSPHKGATTHFEPLLQSSTDAALMDTSRVAGAPVPDVMGLLKDFVSTNKRYTIAARVTGITGTAFPDGPPKDKPDPKVKKTEAQLAAEKKAASDQVKTAKQPINVVVVADTDLLDDRFWIEFQNFLGRKVGQPIAGNGDLVQNAVDSLMGTNDLIGLRSRGTAERPFMRVDKIKRAADDKYHAREKELQDRLKDAQEKLASVKPAEDANGDVALTPDQQKAVDQFRTQIVSTRTELRQVQLALRQNIDALKNKLVLLDIGLMPTGVAGLALVLGYLRARRRQTSTRAN
jgi:ABC-type uncharacterized transport system involved in gliding motility auxiliary subunit